MDKNIQIEIEYHTNEIKKLVNQLINENSRLRNRIHELNSSAPKNDLPCIYKINGKCVKTQELCVIEDKKNCKWSR